MRVSGRAVLVTGGSRGIGAAIVRAFAARGDRVAIHYREAAGAAAALRDSLPGGGHVAVRADMADADAVRLMVDAAAAALGGLDVLVNNAGVYLAHPVLDGSYAQWQQAWQDTLGVNLVGAANATWCAVRHMIARGGGAGGGRIVNVGSRGAFRGEPAHPAYGASKAGLHAFGQSLAVALAPHGITVASVAPGYVATDMTSAELATPAGDAIRAQSPFNRVATAEEVAEAVVYLASPSAEWASGSILDLNGASYLRSLAGAVFGVHLAGDRAVPDVVAVPQAEALPRAEERDRLVVGHRDRHLGAVARVQGLVVVPAQLGGEAPFVAGPGQALRPDHQRVGVIGVLARDGRFAVARPRPRSRLFVRRDPLAWHQRHPRHSWLFWRVCRRRGTRGIRARRNRVESDERPISNLPHLDHLPQSEHSCSHVAVNDPTILRLSSLPRPSGPGGRCGIADEGGSACAQPLDRWPARRRSALLLRRPWPVLGKGLHGLLDAGNIPLDLFHVQPSSDNLIAADLEQRHSAHPERLPVPAGPRPAPFGPGRFTVPDRPADFGVKVGDPREYGRPVGAHLGSPGEGPARVCRLLAAVVLVEQTSRGIEIMCVDGDCQPVNH